MKTLMRFLIGVATALLLASCGGGGGCGSATDCTAAATPAPAPGTTQTASAMTLFFTNSTATFAPLTLNNVTSTPNTYAVATVLDANQAPLANQIVSFSTDTAIASLSSSMGLSDANGRAWVRIQPASITTTGAAILTASSTMAGQTVTASQGYQVGASNVTLGTMTVTPTSVSALGTASVSVPVLVNGVAAAAGQVSVTLQPSCGYFTASGTPSITVQTGTGGAATSTWHSESTCGGQSVTITATATGATQSSQGTVTVTSALPANIVYSGATANSLVVSTATSGTKQSTLTFQVVDNNLKGMANQTVTFSLDSSSQGAGVTFAGGGTTSSATTDTAGNVTIAINSGAVPTPVTVTGSVTAGTATYTASSINLVVNSGPPSQNRTSLAASKLNIEGMNIDGATTVITARTSDRMGNPPPVNTAVTFVTGYGAIVGSCATDATGACSATYTTSGLRPASGEVTILAYLAGEESYIDQNGDNSYTSGEPFDDLGQPYRDDNLDGTFTAATEQKFGTASGSSACNYAISPYAPDQLSVTNTCDGVWTGATLVRQQIRIGLSSDTAAITLSGALSRSAFNVQVSDSTAGSLVGMAAGSQVAAVVTPAAGTTTCALVSVSPSTVPNQVGSSLHTITLNNNGCAGATVTVTVTSLSGRATPATFGPL